MRDTLKVQKYLDTFHINIRHVLSILVLAPAGLQYFNCTASGQPADTGGRRPGGAGPGSLKCAFNIEYIRKCVCNFLMEMKKLQQTL